MPACYSEPQAATDEHALLRDLIAQHRPADRGPSRATEAAMIRLFEQGGYNWMHSDVHFGFWILD